MYIRSNLIANFTVFLWKFPLYVIIVLWIYRIFNVKILWIRDALRVCHFCILEQDRPSSAYLSIYLRSLTLVTICSPCNWHFKTSIGCQHLPLLLTSHCQSLTVIYILLSINIIVAAMQLFTQNRCSEKSQHALAV